MDQEIKDDLETAMSATYAINISTRNFRLNTQQREAVHNMVLQMLAQTRVKMGLVLAADPDSVIVSAELRTSTAGKRELFLETDNQDV
jgi:hypothetical protein